MLRFSSANRKITKLKKVPELAPFLTEKRKIYSFDLLSGHNCPFAERCLSKVVVVDGKRKIQDGEKTEFRCFSASQEALFTGVYNLRKHNADTIIPTKNKAELLRNALPKNAGIIRIHVAGDFFNQDYFDAWLKIAKENPNTLFYAYTKSLKYWIKRTPPNNFVLTASYGGRLDNLIEQNGLRYARVVYHEDEARNLGLEIDDDDSHAAKPGNQSFALLIHGTQPKKGA